jgi:dTDP-L-rhamnose 4-epimerase
MSNILITGGAGFIGSNLALALLKKGYRVTVLDNLLPQVHGKDPCRDSYLFLSIKDKVNFINGTVTSREDWLKAIKGQDIIVHLAAETGTGQSMYDIDHYTKVNIGGTALLLDILANTKHSIRKIIVASSRAVYGEGRYLNGSSAYFYPPQRELSFLEKGDFEVKKNSDCHGQPIMVSTDEDSKIHPSSIYGITKQYQEQMISTVCRSIGIKAVTFRYQNVFGLGQSLSNPYTGILSLFSVLIKKGKPINIFEDGKQCRDFVFIDDVVNATILGIEKEEANGHAFNVGLGEPVNLITAARELISNFGIEVPLIISGSYRLGDIRHNYADMTKIKNMLGFQPQFSFKAGIKKFTDWVNTCDIEETRYEESIEEMRDKGLFK